MVMGDIQAANEELTGYLPSGKNYIPFTSSLASAMPYATTVHSSKQALDNLVRMLSSHLSEAYGPSTESHASSMPHATTTHTTANVPSTTTKNWPLGTVMTIPSPKSECRDVMMNNVNINISVSLRKIVIAILVLLTILVVMAAGFVVLYCASTPLPVLNYQNDLLNSDWVQGRRSPPVLHTSNDTRNGGRAQNGSDRGVSCTLSNYEECLQNKIRSVFDIGSY
ncbi:hypothetical protein F5887DRAFT_960575 [Amanita rubescens]|nr:hypothetical protein F5887DRAFT_960575 [Amanita rubescens]